LHSNIYDAQTSHHFFGSLAVSFRIMDKRSSAIISVLGKGEGRPILFGGKKPSREQRRELRQLLFARAA
jgi:hypothetical protein